MFAMLKESFTDIIIRTLGLIKIFNIEERTELMDDLMQRLINKAGLQGADLSPGDPLCQEAHDEIYDLREALRDLWSARHMAAGVKVFDDHKAVMARAGISGD